MKADDVLSLVWVDPFRPFSLMLANGREIRIENPGMVAMLGTGRTLFVAHPKSSKFELIDMMLINSVVVHADDSGDHRRQSA